jgi:sugar phosphate permease
METDSSRHPRFFYGWLIIAVSVITSILVYGFRYSFSIFFPEILNEFGWSRGDTALMMSINIFIYGLAAPVAGTLSSRGKTKQMMLAGAITLALAMIGCSMTSRLWHFYLCFGVMAPIGTAFCGWPIIAPALMNWFATRRGFVLGFGQSTGLSFVYGLMAQYLIARLGWRMAYLALAAILITILIPLHRFVFYHHPKHKGLRAYGSDDLAAEKSVDRGNIFQDWTLRLILRTPQLWLLVLYFFLFWGITCFLVLSHQIKYAEDVGYNATFAVSVFALYGLAMLAGQFSGVMSDRIGREKTMLISSTSAVAGLLCLISVRDTSASWLLYAYALSFGYGAGLSTIVVFAGTADIFHGKHYGTASGIMLFGMGMGGSIGPWIGGYLYDTYRSYDYAFILCMACIVLGSISYWIAAPRHANRLRALRLGSRTPEAPRTTPSS